MSTATTESVDTVTVLLVDEDDATAWSSKLCTVSLEASGGPTITADLIVDTGSGVSILPEHMYRRHFSHVALSKPKRRLTTYTKSPIQVLGCLELKVTYKTNSASVHIHVVPAGTPILGMDLFNALQLEIMDGKVTIRLQEIFRLLKTKDLL